MGGAGLRVRPSRRRPDLARGPEPRRGAPVVPRACPGCGREPGVARGGPLGGAGRGGCGRESLGRQVIRRADPRGLRGVADHPPPAGGGSFRRGGEDLRGRRRRGGDGGRFEKGRLAAGGGNVAREEFTAFALAQMIKLPKSLLDELPSPSLFFFLSENVVKSLNFSPLIVSKLSIILKIIISVRDLSHKRQLGKYARTLIKIKNSY